MLSEKRIGVLCGIHVNIPDTRQKVLRFLDKSDKIRIGVNLIYPLLCYAAAMPAAMPAAMQTAGAASASGNGTGGTDITYFAKSDSRMKRGFGSRVRHANRLVCRGM